MKRSAFVQLACIPVWLVSSVAANGQSVGQLYFDSTVTVTPYSVHLNTYAEVDYVTANYYDLTSQTWFYQDYTQINYQSVTTSNTGYSADFYTTPTPGHWYQGGSEETLTAYYEEYVYSTINYDYEWEWYDPFSYDLLENPNPPPEDPVFYDEVWAPGYYQLVPAGIILALSWDGDGTEVPILTGITVSGTQVPGGSGSVTLYGSYLTTRNAGLGVVNVGGGIAVTGYPSNSSTYPWSITFTYQIPGGVSPGNYGVTVTTAWGQSNPMTFTVSAPPTLRVTSDSQVVSQNQTVYITPGPPPHMPVIQASLLGTVSGTVTYSLTLQYNATLLLPQQTIPANQTWTAPSGFYGGQATLSWSYNGVVEPTFTFEILGQNPTVSAATSALQSTGFWFAPNIGFHETNMQQFCQPAGVAYCSNSANTGLPVFGPPNGYGIMQLDPPPSTDAVFNWQTNINGAQTLLQALAGPIQYGTGGQAYPFWIRQVKQWQDFNAIHSPQVPPPNDQPESSYCTFTLSPAPAPTYTTPNTGQGQRYWFGDAILMKQYAGATTNYISFIQGQTSGNWSESQANSVRPDIAYEFCTCLAQSTCQHSGSSSPTN